MTEKDPAEAKPFRAGRWFGLLLIRMALFSAIVFVPAGTLRWTGGWLAVGVMAAISLVSAAVLLPRHQELLAERSQMRAGTKKWDKVLAPLVATGTIPAIIVAGLAQRFDWHDGVPATVQALGAVVGMAGFALGLWAMRVNRFFATTVRIQTERDHTAVTDGPYRYVRHPGYVSGIVFLLALPAILGSLWAYAAAVPELGVIVLRTALEDRTRRAELPGYADYATRTRARLLPGVW